MNKVLYNKFIVLLTSRLLQTNRDVFNVGEKIEEEDQACLFMTSLSKSYDPIMMLLLGKKSALIMSEVTAILLNFKSLRQYEKDVSGSSSALTIVSDW
jgi:hypothetical protein